MLRKHFDKKNRNEYGLSMIELLVVIVIIGILAAVAIGVTLNQRKKANDSAVESDVRRVVTEVETALVDHPNAVYINGSTDPETQTLTIESHPNANEEHGFVLAEDISISEGVTIRVLPADPGDGPRSGDTEWRFKYVVRGWHENASKYSQGNAFLFDSYDGTFHDNNGRGRES